ncbi:MAG: T9SS type A sorting domain-containing protein [Bacteroidota bacterium]
MFRIHHFLQAFLLVFSLITNLIPNAYAQTTSDQCFDFDAFETNVTLANIRQDGVRIIPFIPGRGLVLDNQENYQGFNVQFGQGSYLYTFAPVKIQSININDRFDIVEFDYINLSGPVIIAFNGGDTTHIDLNEPFTRLPGGHEITIDSTQTLVGTVGFNTGHMTITGPSFYSVSVGFGGESAIDNLCYGGLANTCHIHTVTAEATPCTADDLYFVDVDAVYFGTSDSVNIQGNGIDYGFFAYEDLPVRLGPFTANSGGLLEFILIDMIDSDCIGATEIPTIGCGCSIQDVVTTASECDNDNQYTVNIDFNHANTAGDNFMIIGGGIFYGMFPYSSLPVELGPFPESGLDMEFNIFDATDPSCIGFARLEAVECTPDCSVTDIELDFIGCSDRIQVANLNFNFSNPPSDSVFFVYDSRGIPIVEGSLKRLPWSWINIFDYDSDHIETITICLDDDRNCCTEYEFDVPQCDFPCFFVEYHAEPVCISDSTFFIQVSVQNNYQPSIDSGFLVVVNDFYYGPYPYGQTIISEAEVGFFLTGQEEEYEVRIIDAMNPLCDVTVTFDDPECSETCRIQDIVAQPYNCDRNGQFQVELSFDYANTNDSFKLFINTQLGGDYSYEDLPITIGPFDGDGTTSYTFSVYDILPSNRLDFGCAGRVTVDPISCQGGFCSIEDLRVRPGACTSDSTYQLHIDFDYAYTPSDSFSIIDLNTNELLYIASVNQLPLTIQNYPDNGAPQDAFLICFNFPFCCESVGWSVPDCSREECEITNLIVTPRLCNSDSTILAMLSFDVENNLSDSFFLYSNNVLVGRYRYIPTFRNLIHDFPASDTTVYNVRVCMDTRPPECCAEYTFEYEGCADFNECAIDSIEAIVGRCNPDSTFSLTLDLSYSGDGTDSVGVAGSFYYEKFAAQDFPLTIDNYFARPNQMEYMIVCRTNNFYCCDTVVFNTPTCPGGGGQCNLFNMVAQPRQCDSNGLFLVDLGFQYTNTSDSFNLRGNGNDYGWYSYTDLPIVLGPFRADGRTIYEFVASDGEDPTCSVENIILPFDCIDLVCDIQNIQVDVGDCTSDSTFAITVDFDYTGGRSDTIEISNTDNIFTEYFISSGFPVTINNYVFNGQQSSFLTICNFHDRSCCDTIEVSAPDCLFNDRCNIYDMVVEPSDCDSNGMFLVDINFAYQNVSDSFNLRGNGNDYGWYSYTNLPVTLGPLNGDGLTFYEFIVMDDGNPDCTEEFVLGDFNCDSLLTCEIRDLDIQIGDCTSDSTYSITIDFTAVNPYTNFFEVFDGNDNFLEIHPLSSLPLTIDFPATGDTIDILNVCISDRRDCCIQGFLSAPDCINDDCQIRDLEAYPVDCNGDGSFSLIIDLEVWNPASDSFTINSIAGFVGTYAYDDLPLFLPDYVSGNDSIEVLIAADLSDTICEAQIVFEPLVCFDCSIENMTTAIIDCEDQQFYVELDFDYRNVGTIGFQVFGNGQRYGSYNYDELPIQLGPFDSNSSNRTLEFTAFDLVNFDCRAEVTIDVPECPDGEDTEVWPGDANFDNIANHFDLLHIGMAFGESGPNRGIQSSTWSAFNGDDWFASFRSGLNFKHSDCNGDGIIDEKDINVIDANYRQTHGPVAAFDWPQGNEEDPPIRVDLETASPRSGQSFRAPIVLGTERNQVEDIYGLAFTLQFASGSTLPLNTRITVGDSWLGQKDETLVSINRAFASEGIIEMAITRIDQQNVSGHGEIASFIGIIDNISGRADLEVDILDVKAINKFETPVLLYNHSSKIDIITNVNIPDNFEMLRVYPNPTNSLLHIHDLGQAGMNRIRIFNSLGQLVKEIYTKEEMERIDVSEWSSGIYFAEVQFDVRVMTKKFKVSK